MDFYCRVLKIYEKLHSHKLRFIYVNNKNKNTNDILYYYLS